MSEPTVNPAGAPPAHAESPWWSTLLLGAAAVLVLVGVMMNWHPADEAAAAARFALWRGIIGVIVVLAIFTILYKENPIFRFMEHIFIGLATGASIVVVWIQMVYPNWFVPMMPGKWVQGGQGHWWMICELLLGLLFFTVYFPRLAWMNRFALGVIIGWAAGYGFREFWNLLAPQFVKSFDKTPITTYGPGASTQALNNVHLGGDVWFHPLALVFIIVLLCVGAYFFYSVEHRARWMRQPASAGRFFLMITLGAIFGTTVMGRFSLVIERLNFLITTIGGWFQS